MTKEEVVVRPFKRLFKCTECIRKRVKWRVEQINKTNHDTPNGAVKLSGSLTLLGIVSGAVVRGPFRYCLIGTNSLFMHLAFINGALECSQVYIKRSTQPSVSKCQMNQLQCWPGSVRFSACCGLYSVPAWSWPRSRVSIVAASIARELVTRPPSNVLVR